MQRDSFEYGQRFIEETSAIQRDAAAAFARSGIVAQRTAHEQGQAALREATDAYLRMVEQVLDEMASELRSATDDEIDRSVRLVREMLVAQFDRNADLVRSAVDAQFDAVWSAFDAEAFSGRAAINDQLERVESQQSEAWDAVETAVVEATALLTDQQQAMLARSLDTFLDQQESTQRTLAGVQ